MDFDHLCFTCSLCGGFSPLCEVSLVSPPLSWTSRSLLPIWTNWGWSWPSWRTSRPNTWASPPRGPSNLTITATEALPGTPDVSMERTWKRCCAVVLVGPSQCAEQSGKSDPSLSFLPLVRTTEASPGSTAEEFLPPFALLWNKKDKIWICVLLDLKWAECAAVSQSAILFSIFLPELKLQDGPERSCWCCLALRDLADSVAVSKTFFSGIFFFNPNTI